MEISLTKREVNRQRWLAHIESWKHSGLTQKTFCQQHGLGQRTSFDMRPRKGANSKLLISRVLRAAPLAGFEPISHRHSLLRSNKVSCNREIMHIANRKAAKMGGLLRSAKGRLLGRLRSAG